MNRFADEVYLPIAAIENNVGYLLDKKPTILTSDGKEAEILESRHINPLSEEGISLIRRLYGMALDYFLLKWYRETEFVTLDFLHLKLKEL